MNAALWGRCQEEKAGPPLWPPRVTTVSRLGAQRGFERRICTVCFPVRYLQGQIPQRQIHVPICFSFFFGNPCLIGSRVYSALCLQPGAQCWQGKQTTNGQQQGQEWAKKNPQASSGGRRAARMACPPEPGLRAPKDLVGWVPATVA